MSDVSTCPRCRRQLPPDAPAGLCPDCLLEQGLQSLGGPAAAAGGPESDRTRMQAGGFVPPEASELARHFQQLEILDLIGHGGMGAVYRARQTKLDRLVALKILRPESSVDPAFAERFNREAKTLARLQHPHIVGVHDFGEVRITDPATGAPRTLYYFIMEYVDGVSLRELIRDHELQPPAALAIVPQICDALQYAHDEGVVHRDIKPENILINQQGQVKIADFGLAKLVAAEGTDFTLTATHQVMGTPRYMAPEQMQGSHAVDHRADIYSLGVVLYEMLTGDVPAGHFDPPSRKVLVDVRLDEIVLRTLAREPERRYQAVSAVKTDLQRVSSTGGERAAEAMETQISEPPAGISTIMEREAGRLWRWIAGLPQKPVDPRSPLPLGLMLLLCGAGIGCGFLPWARVDGMALARWSMFRGVDLFSGVVATYAFAALALLLLAIPVRQGMTFFKAAAWSATSVVILGNLIAYSDDLSRANVRLSDGSMVPVLRIDHQIWYEPGYYAAVIFAVSLLLLSVLGFRHVGEHAEVGDVSRYRGLSQDELHELLIPIVRRNRMEAVRVYREVTGARLSSAAAAVDQLAVERQIPRATSGGRVARLAVGVVALLLLIVGLLFGLYLLRGGTSQSGVTPLGMLVFVGGPIVVLLLGLMWFGFRPDPPAAETPPEELVRRRVRGPAISLMLYGLLLLLPAALLITNGVDLAQGPYGDSFSPVGAMIAVAGVLLIGVAGLVLRGGWHLLSLEKYRAALLAGFLGQPVGLWALFVLGRPEVKAAFAESAAASWEPRHAGSADERTGNGKLWVELLAVAIVPVLVWLVLGPAWRNVREAATVADSPPVLLVATRDGDAAAVQRLLERGEDPNRRQPGFNQPLWWAAFRGERVIAQLLLEAGAEVDAPGLHGISPLLVAASQGHQEIVRMLLEAGADVNARDRLAERKSYSILSDIGEVRDYRWPGSGQTALLLAVHGGHYDVAQLLLEAGADPAYTDARGQKALEIARGRNDLRMQELLLQHAAGTTKEATNEKADEPPAQP